MKKPKKDKKKSWFDRDTAIAGKVRAENTALCTLKVQLESRVAECREVLGQAEAKSSQCAEEVKVEKDTLSKRIGFLEAVVAADSSDLKGLISQFPSEPGQSLPGAPPGDVRSATSFAAQMSAAPPCCRFKELKTIATFRDTLDDYWKCQTAVELQELAKQRAEERKPIAELSGACNSGLRELKKALADFSSRAAKVANPKSAAGILFWFQDFLQFCVSFSRVFFLGKFLC